MIKMANHAALRHVVSPDGTRIGYTCEGEGRATVLLHGMQRTGVVWDGIAQTLAPGRRLLRPDLRGRGHSEVPRTVEAYALPRLVEDLEAVLSDGDQGPVDLVAWSMGCSVAWAFSHRPLAARVARWVFISGSPSSAGTHGWFQATDLTGAQAQAQERALRKRMTDTADPFAVAAAWMSVRDADFLSHPPAVEAPALFIHGDADDECPLAAVAALSSRLPRARLEVLAGVGHNPMQERPERVTALLTDFLS